MKKRTLNISLPSDLIKRADIQADRNYASRSEYIRRAVLAQVNVDEANSTPEAYRDYAEVRRNQLKDYVRKQMETEDKQG